jgi:hypothetical protein
VTALPLHVIPVIIDNQIWLRLYRGGDLKFEVPLRQRQAMVLAAQLLNHSLMVEGPARAAPSTCTFARTSMRNPRVSLR